MPKRDEILQFEGFHSPNYTPVPDEVFDLLAPRLKEAELRVLLYIIRRTFGFKKSSDNISIRQMIEGINTKEGKILDSGTGLSKPAVTKAVQSLVKRKIILATQRRTIEKGDEATTYQLNILTLEGNSVKEVPVLTKLTGGGVNEVYTGVLTKLTHKKQLHKKQLYKIPLTGLLRGEKKAVLKN